MLLLADGTDPVQFAPHWVLAFLGAILASIPVAYGLVKLWNYIQDTMKQRREQNDAEERKKLDDAKEEWKAGQAGLITRLVEQVNQLTHDLNAERTARQHGDQRILKCESDRASLRSMLRMIVIWAKTNPNARLKTTPELEALIREGSDSHAPTPNEQEPDDDSHPTDAGAERS